VLVTVVWSLALVLITAPAYVWALPGGGAHIAGHLIRYPGALIVAVLAGLVLLLASPALTRWMAAGDVAVARGLLGSGREELTARIGELETSRAKVMDAAEMERMRIERDLHDGAQQRLVSLAMDLGRAKAKFGTDPEGAAEIVSQAHDQAKEALAELRNLVRGVHPPVLSDRGLDAALSGLAALSPVPVTVSVELPSRPPAAIEAIAYFVVAEALTNIAKHAYAHHARILVVGVGDQLSLEITDDGVGGADPAGRGLSGLAARVAGVDGQYVEERYATELLSDRPQGVGYLLKDRVADLTEFLDALDRVAAQGSALDPEVVAQLLARSRHPLAALTPRELAVLGLMAEGLSNAAIAAELVVSDGAVEKHINNIFAKLGLAPADRDHRRVLAVLRYLGADGA
jgi:signal transduction histidine kinase/DNA-binding CsgD family transcriptional regulator